MAKKLSQILNEAKDPNAGPKKDYDSILDDVYNGELDKHVPKDKHGNVMIMDGDRGGWTYAVKHHDGKHYSSTSYEDDPDNPPSLETIRDEVKKQNPHLPYHHVHAAGKLIHQNIKIN